jgi:hypothetical protein
MTQVPCWVPKHIRHHRTNCCRYGDQARPICAPLAYGELLERCEKTDVSEEKKTCRSDTLLSEISHWLAWDRTRIIAMRKMQRFSNEVRWHVVSAVRCGCCSCDEVYMAVDARNCRTRNYELSLVRVRNLCVRFLTWDGLCVYLHDGFGASFYWLWDAILRLSATWQKFCQSNMREVYEYLSEELDKRLWVPVRGTWQTLVSTCQRNLTNVCEYLSEELDKRLWVPVRGAWQPFVSTCQRNLTNVSEYLSEELDRR